MTTITLEKVSRAFGPVTAVDSVDLVVQPGEFVTLLGHSGCGKTTTLRMVAGLERNTGGRIAIDGKVVSDADRGFYVPAERRGLGMVFQSYAIWPHMTVFENVAYPLKIRSRPSGEIAERVTRVLRLVEMEPFAQRPAPALSGGQQQRVAIARALVSEPKVLLLDEPLSNLDARLRTQMGDETRNLQKRLGITSLYVTHDQAEAMALSDRVVVMHKGAILQIGAPEDIYLRPNSRAVAEFFGSPNLLDGRVADCVQVGPSDFSVRVVGRGWAGICRSGVSFNKDEIACAMIRPENLKMAAGAAPVGENEIVLRGVVSGTVFRGAHRSAMLSGEAGNFSVAVPVLQSVNTGDEMTFVADAGAAWAVQS